ncbi:oxidoreductase [Streptomyces sp. 8K308]|uniref:CE1759 family FMN reductase n=1 Tax=Streptomyces sp. 8K308 TaxID=2530388 RepID=UPI00104877C7|nr:CE1759 family FMN reductase [Streptomyces sp. 8K308]TDC20771.1 oxidoreductase [Streptomyces sp. 8K308]
MRITVVASGLSVPSSTRLLADRLAAATAARAEGAEVTVVELRELAADIASHLTGGFPSPRLATAIESVTAADGLIAVTPVFSASYSGLFKSFFDVLEPESLAGKPVLLGATGGTPRHSLVIEHALRPLFAHLRAVMVPTGVYAASQDWGAVGDDYAAGLAERVDRAAAELVALLAPDTRPAPPRPPAGTRRADGPENVVPFAERLAALGIDPPKDPRG